MLVAHFSVYYVLYLKLISNVYFLNDFIEILKISDLFGSVTVLLCMFYFVHPLLYFDTFASPRVF